MGRKSFLITAVTAMFFVVLLLPFVSMLIYAFFARWQADMPLPENFTLDGFRTFFRRDFDTAVKSVLFSLGAAAVTLILCVPTARGLVSARSSVRQLIEPLLYLPMLLPAVSVSMGSHKLFLALSLAGTPAVFLMHVYFAFPYVFKLVYSCYTALGTDTETAARNLGAGRLRVFLEIHLPTYLSGYMTAFLMGFIISYSQYFVNFYLGGADNINFSMVMTPLITGSNRNLASVYTLMYLLFGGAAAAVCTIIPNIVLKRNTNG